MPFSEVMGPPREFIADPLRFDPLPLAFGDAGP